ncbi:LOW QUALITY PROTEIN: hydrolase, partial [Micromonospora sp. M42]
KGSFRKNRFERILWCAVVDCCDDGDRVRGPAWAADGVPDLGPGRRPPARGTARRHGIGGELGRARGGLLDALALTRVTVLGHSSGSVAAHLLARAYPDRVAALVLVEPPPPVPLGLRLPPRPAGPLPYDWAAREAVVAELNAPPPTWWEELTEITAPTLVVAGGPASHLPQHELARMAARIPAARLVTVEAGHAVPAARPAEFAAAVRDFLAALPG